MVVEEGREEVGERIAPVLPPLALAFKRTVATIERESGIEGMKWFLLTVLSRRDGLSQGEFCRDYEMLDPSRVTRTAQALGAEGLLRRERDAEDNRTVRMYLTDEGRRLLERLPEANERVRRRMRGALSDEELEELRRMLWRLAEAMKD
jgi:MarR family transcriptional regulator, organic hydroperoxide resistance regulator